MVNYLHVKSGGQYSVLEEGKLQTAEPVGDMTDVVIYRSTSGGIWVRPTDEFYDGRFEIIATSVDGNAKQQLLETVKNLSATMHDIPSSRDSQIVIKLLEDLEDKIKRIKTQ